MSTPSIQTLITQAQQVLNLKSTNEIRATLAAVLANANVGTPLNPNLTTQQLWDEFYEIVRQPSDDIMSIVVDQMMRMVFSPPAPGGAGANHEVIYNNNGVLAGDTKFLWDDALNKLDIDGSVTAGSATITGAATVGTTLGVTGVSTLTGNAFANGSATVAGGTPGAFANAALTINNRGGVSDLSLISLGYRPNGTVLNGAAYIGFITTSGAGNVLGDLIFGTRSVTTDTAPTERYRIDSTGIATWSNVGGVAGTAMTLNSSGLIRGASSADIQTQESTTLTNIGNIGAAHGATTGTYFVAKVGAANGIVELKADARSGAYPPMVFTTGATERLRIDSSGNVGIGVTPSAAQFPCIESQFGTFISRTSTNIANNAYYNSGAWKYIANGSSSLYFQNGNLHQWSVAPSGTAGNAITFTQAMTLDASGALLVGVTSANASGGVLQLKSGITFPATQVASSDANTLDDYEEGTWTGTIGGTTGNPTTPLTATGRYTKIGRQVHVEIGFYGDTTGASGRITVSGLPFTSNASIARPGAILMDTMGTFTGSPVAFLGSGVTSLDLYASNSNGAISSVTHNTGAGRALYMELTYTV